jgi:hypothetical protein
LTFEILPSEPETESSQLVFEESTGTESQKLIMKVIAETKKIWYCILTRRKKKVLVAQAIDE